MTLIKRKNIHPIFKCSDLATHITQSTRSTQWAQTSLAEADHYSHMPTVKILRLGGERLNPPPPKKKKKKFWIITCTIIWLCYSHYIVFCSFILLIYSSQKVSRSLKFYTALHILVLHMHKKFDVDSIDGFWDTEKQSTEASGGKKERKKERTRKLHLQANVTKKVIILHNPSYRLEALRENRPPWLTQIITPIFPNVTMLSLGVERLTPKVLNHYLHHDLGMQQLLWCFFTHRRISRSPPKFNQFFIILLRTTP